jgi:hypothetical protein
MRPQLYRNWTAEPMENVKTDFKDTGMSLKTVESLYFRKDAGKGRGMGCNEVILDARAMVEEC